MSSKIKLTSDEMGLIALFESVTGAQCKDCIIDGKSERLIFVVKQGNMGAAVGRNGSHIKLLRRMTSKQVEIVEFSDDPGNFIVNSLAPAKVREIRITEKVNGEKMVVVAVDPRDKGMAIGRNGRTIERTRQLAKRYFDIGQVIVA